MSDPKYKQIAAELLSDITAGKFQSSGKLPSESQLVKRFDVSRPTAAKALRQLQEQGLIERRAGSGTFVRSNPVHVSNAQQVIGLLVPEITSTEILEVICGDLARMARLHEYSLLWGNEVEENVLTGQANKDLEDANADDGQRSGHVKSLGLSHLKSDLENGPNLTELTSAICQVFIDQNVAGVFFAPFEHHEFKHELNFRIAELLRQSGIAVVLLDRDVRPFPMRSEFDLVGVDNFACGFTAADHLLKLGCNRLAFLSPPYSAPTVTQRIAGARQAIAEQIRHDAELTVWDIDPSDRDALQRLLQCDTDAIICSNDSVAASLMQTLSKLNVDVPGDIRLVGFDDVKYAQLLTVPLTTVRQPCRDIAVVAFRAMLDQIEKVIVPPRHYLLPGQLIVRESCGAYGSSVTQ